jgi:hypothetical protein
MLCSDVFFYPACSLSHPCFPLFQFPVYSLLHDHLPPALAGGTAGAVASLTVYPLDIIRTRLVGQSEPKVGKTAS